MSAACFLKLFAIGMAREKNTGCTVLRLCGPDKPSQGGNTGSNPVRSRPGGFPGDPAQQKVAIKWCTPGGVRGFTPPNCAQFCAQWPLGCACFCCSIGV